MMKKESPINKSVNNNVDAMYKVWLGKWFLFQTFEELDSVKDKESEVQQIRQLMEDAE